MVSMRSTSLGGVFFANAMYRHATTLCCCLPRFFSRVENSLRRRQLPASFVCVVLSRRHASLSAEQYAWSRYGTDEGDSSAGKAAPTTQDDRHRQQPSHD